MNSEGLFQFILVKYESSLAVSFKERVVLISATGVRKGP